MGSLTDLVLDKFIEKFTEKFIDKVAEKMSVFINMMFKPAGLNNEQESPQQIDQNSAAANHPFFEDLDKLIERLNNTFKSHTGSIKQKLETLREYRLKLQLLFSSASQAHIADQNSELNKWVREIQHDFDVINALLDMQEQLARNEETLVQSIRNIINLPVTTLRLSCERAFKFFTSMKEDSQEQMVDQIWAINPLPVVKALDKLIERLNNICKWYNGIAKEELEWLQETRLKIQSLLSAASQEQIVDLNSEINKLTGKIDDGIKELNVLLDAFDFIQPEEQQQAPICNILDRPAKRRRLCGECALKIDSNHSEISDNRA